MLPLFLKDGLLVPYIVSSLAFVYLSCHLLSAVGRCTEDQLRLGLYHRLLLLPDVNLAPVVRWKFYISVAIMVGLSAASAAVAPPPHLPDLFPVMVSVFSFLNFLGTFVYFNVLHFTTQPMKKNQKKNK